MKRLFSVLFCLVLVLLWANPTGQLAKSSETANLINQDLLPSAKPLQFKQIRVPLTEEIDDLLVADLNGDGYADIVTLQEDKKTITVFMGDKNQKYTKKYIRKFPDAEDSFIGAADFDGNGKVDIAAVCQPAEKYLAILPGKGNGQLGKPKIAKASETDEPGFVQVVILDFNGDGKPDILGLLKETSTTEPSTIVAFRNLKRNKFKIIRTTLNSSTDAIVAGDFDGDGLDDFLGCEDQKYSSDSLIFYKSNGDGTFTERNTISGSSDTVSKHMKAADLDGDGRLDLVGFGKDSLWTWKGAKEVKFKKKKKVKGSDDGHRLFVVDLNKDNNPDILTSHSDGVWIYTNKGKGKFGPPAKHAESASFYNDPLGYADINKDGKADIIARFCDTDVITFTNGGKPATLNISNLTLTDITYWGSYGAYISGHFSFSGSGIDLRYTGKEGSTYNAYIEIWAHFDFGTWGKTGWGIDSGPYLHKPGQNFGTIYFNDVFIWTGIAGPRTLSAATTMKINEFYLVDYNSVCSNKLSYY
jgi:hypothetical protein